MDGKTIFFTQRVDIITSYNERRDCADQRISGLLEACGYIPIPVPNNVNIAAAMWDVLDPSGLVLTGGNNLVKYGGDAAERDATEKVLLDRVLSEKKPVYGFCRGMQFIIDYFKGELESVDGHASVRHEVNGKLGEDNVNSYHMFGCRNLPKGLLVLEVSKDGVVEALKDITGQVLATMWHPERENPFRERDLMMIKNHF